MELSYAIRVIREHEKALAQKQATDQLLFKTQRRQVIYEQRRAFRSPKSFWQLLAEAGFRSYDAYLASDHWKEFRQRYRRSGLPRHCLVCNSPHYELHHWRYHNLTREHLSDVIPLCRDHHHTLHAWVRKHGKPLHLLHEQLKEVFGLSPEQTRAALAPMLNCQKIKDRRCEKCQCFIKPTVQNDVCWRCHRRALDIHGLIEKKYADPPIKCKTCKNLRKPELFPPSEKTCIHCFRRFAKSKFHTDKHLQKNITKHRECPLCRSVLSSFVINDRLTFRCHRFPACNYNKTCKKTVTIQQ